MGQKNLTGVDLVRWMRKFGKSQIGPQGLVGFVGRMSGVRVDAILKQAIDAGYLVAYQFQGKERWRLTSKAPPPLPKFNIEEDDDKGATRRPQVTVPADVIAHVLKQEEAMLAAHRAWSQAHDAYMKARAELAASLCSLSQRQKFAVKDALGYRSRCMLDRPEGTE
jgi:hypothetical protein